jgi:[ribosomal protein S18]-alanine N-acetyltransferase
MPTTFAVWMERLWSKRAKNILPIRPATPADIPAIIDLASRSTSAAHWSIEQYQIFTNEIPRRVALINDEQSVVHAFLIGLILDHEWELENVVVSESRRRQGIGKMLLEKFLAATKTEGAKVIFLEVRESNVAARHLYESCGFAENGRRERYYSEPIEDAILYQIFLT